MNGGSRAPWLTALCLLAGVAMATPGLARGDNDRCAGSRDVKLVNGKIHTLDNRNSIVSSATIRNGKFTAVGREARSDDGGSCMRVINLRGRTAVPGLVDNHNHIVLLGLRPGHDTRLESAFSIAEVQATIRARSRNVPRGEFITAMGGWIPAQFAENRLPTLAELDAAAPSHPVLVYQTFLGPATTNTLGRDFLTGKGVAVDAAGNIAAAGPSVAALNALRAIQTFADKKRGTRDALAYSVSLGITTNVDMGGFILPGTPNIQNSFMFDSLASFDPFTAYDPLLALHEEGKLSARVRLYYLSMDLDPDAPMTSRRVLNAFANFGDDMVRSSGIGEFATNWPLFGNPVEPPNFVNALTIVAQRGWAFQQHTLSLFEDTFSVGAFEKVNQTIPIADLRWSLGHVPQIDQTVVNRLKAIGAGVAVHPFRYLNSNPNQGGPPLRMILDSGIRVGAGSDSAQISTLNPWNMIYYMVTGKNVVGQLVNDGQQITREEAIRLYTVANGWFLREEDKLGSIEEGKLGDVVVLSEDYFDRQRVPDERLRKLHSVLTIVDGKVVHNLLDR
jgi:predicted amidohydrolase YtcJ